MFGINILDAMNILALVLFIAGLLIMALFVVFPVRRLVRQLQKFAEDRKGFGPLKFKNEAELLGQVFKLLTTELKTKEEDLRRLYEQAAARAQFMERYSERLVEIIPVGVVALTSRGTVTTLNSEAEKMFGTSLADAAGKSHILLWGEASRLADIVGEVLRRKAPLDESEVLWHGVGGKDEVRSLRIVGAILSGDQPPSEEVYVFTFYDLTPIRRLEEKIRTAERLAAIGTLSAGLAHEIRNPLSAILGYSNLLKKKTKDSELTELADTVEKEAQGLNRVVNEFLEFARNHEALSSPIHYQDAIEEVIGRLARVLKDRGVTIRYRGFPGTEVCPLDKPSIQQLLYNLLLNAIEASPPGASVDLSYEASREGGIQLIVRDEGLGISPEQESKIFDPFFTTKPEGTGLGLSIVHRIVTAAGGEVAFTSEAGKGSRFVVSLPRPQPDKLKP